VLEGVVVARIGPVVVARVDGARSEARAEPGRWGLAFDRAAEPLGEGAVVGRRGDYLAAILDRRRPDRPVSPGDRAALHRW
jgi:hypothetical protein